MVELAKTPEVENLFKVIFLIGRGSRLPNILDNIFPEGSNIDIRLVVSHKKPEEGEENVPGITYAENKDHRIAYWNLAQMRAADKNAFGQNHNKEEFDKWFMRMFGAFLSQQYYKPDAIFMTGWDLVLEKELVTFFPDIPIYNVHPHPLTDLSDPNQDEIEAPDGTKVEVLRGQEVWERAIEKGLSWSGVTIYRIIADDPDKGHVVTREWLKIEEGETAGQLRKRLDEIEDRITPETILKIASGEITT
ncbi:hypothetical protein HYZ78_02550 [Candidatus Microgenomates bacterium]|nr:hypothetical protein [Candidatus Microgenomates bacterium]